MQIQSANKYLAFIFGVLILLLTYKSPEIDLTYGLDSGYMWALNYLFINDFSFLKTIIYPIGPYGFIKHPLVIGSLPIVSIIIMQGLKLSLLVLSLLKKDDINFYIKTGFLFMVSFFLDIDYIIVFLIITIFLQFGNHLAAILSIAFLTAMGILIKSSIGISSIGIVLGFSCYQFLFNDKVKVLKHILIFTIGFYGFGSLLLLDFTSFPLFVFNTLNLANSYGDALALFPTNNWYYISIFLIATLSAIFLTKNRGLLFALTYLPLFFMWKHGMLREEFFHSKVLLKFLPFLFFIYLSESESKKSYLVALLGFFSFFSFYQNMKNFENFKKITFYWNGLNEVNKSVIYYPTYYSSKTAESIENLKSRILPDSILNIIGNETVDVFPHDLSFLAANKLNYNFRSTLQSGAFSSWLEEKDTESLNASFIIFHYSVDNLANEMKSFDDRYLPNDGMSIFLKLGINYELVKKTKDLMILRKRKMSYDIRTETYFITNNVKVGSPIDLPPIDTNFIYQAKISIKENIFDKIKKLVYKSNPHYIQYTLANEYDYKFRFIPSNDVLVYPFYTSFDSSQDLGLKYFTILGDTTKTYTIEWKKTRIQKEFYGLNSQVFLRHSGSPYRNSVFKDSLQVIKPNDFGGIISCDFNEVDFEQNINKLQLEVEGIISSAFWNNAQIVLELEKNGKKIYYKANELISTPQNNSPFRITQVFEKTKLKDAKLKAYIKNTGTFETKCLNMTFDINYVE